VTRITDDLRPQDTHRTERWHQHLLARGWSRSSAQRAVARVRAFARISREGLANAERADVVNYVVVRAEAAAVKVPAFVKTETWRQWVRTTRRFYRWAVENLQPAPRDPTIGHRLLPSRPAGSRLTVRRERLYERVLHASNLTKRDRSILYLLAHGLLPQEVSRLRREDVDVDRRHVIVRGRVMRTVPLSDNASEQLRRWLGSRFDVPDWPVYPGGRPDRPLSVSAIRALVRRAAQRVFPVPGQTKRLRQIYATGFRNVFLARVARARVAPGALRALTGVDRLSRLTIFGQPEDSAHKELARLARRWPGWL
jgi:integrase